MAAQSAWGVSGKLIYDQSANVGDITLNITGSGAPATTPSTPSPPYTFDREGAESEIRHILWIRGLGEEHLWRVAQETWERKETLLSTRVDSKNKQSLSLKNEIYQLVGFYIAFQGLLITAVAQSSLLHCNNVYIVLALSLLASLVTLAGVLQKYRDYYVLESYLLEEKKLLKAYIGQLQSLTTNGRNFEWSRDAKDQEGEEESSKFRAIIEFFELKYSIIFVAVVLVLFSVLFLVAIRQITCNSGSDQVPGPP